MFYPFGFYRFDPTVFILIPAVILTMYAQSKVQNNFNKYLRVSTTRGLTGLQVARSLLDQNGLENIPIELSRGKLSDHYDPTKKVLRLSQEVYAGHSIASVSVAAHEVGHAIQHANGYVPLTFRNAVFPIARFGSSAALPLIVVGLLIPNFAPLINIGILLFAASVLFQIVTLPVEFNASNRALELINSNGFLTDNESNGAKKVLNAAALTYIAAMASGISQLIRLIMIRNRNNRE